MSTRDRVLLLIVLPVSLGIVSLCLSRAQPDWPFLAIVAVISIVAAIAARAGKEAARRKIGPIVVVLFFPALFVAGKIYPQKNATAWDGGLLFGICVFTFAVTLTLIGLFQHEKRG